MDTNVGKINDLANLESFEAAAFEADEKVSQDVCNFVLTLALIYNDLKDLIYWHEMLKKQEPVGSFVISRHWGAYSGIKGHLLRMMVGLFHELIKRIQESDKVIKEPFFQTVLSHISKSRRNIWYNMVSIAQDKHTSTPTGRFALLVRNKMVFHYDPKEIYWGYHTFFSSDLHGAQRCYISRGTNMAETRFFFADASARGYFMKNVQGKQSDELLVNAVNSVGDLSSILYEIIDQFILQRGYAYSAESEET